MMDSSPPAPVALPKTSVPDVSIIIPARNEEANLGPCLESLTAQTGVVFEIIVVDDASTDRTREIADSFHGVHVIVAGSLSQGRAGQRSMGEQVTGKQVTGKTNALKAGAARAHANWLLFTDADTVHLPGSLARALREAAKEKADLLSYSPEQIVATFTERAVMPVVFAELAEQYPPHKVRDRNSGIVAANGQYILVRRTAYDAVGGHAAVASEILEDVALAKLFRNAGFRVYFRYAGDAVRTRMYRNWPQLREGWTKNLALLFPRPGRLLVMTLCRWSVAWFTICIAVSGALSHHFVWIAAAALWLLIYRRIRAAHFTAANNLIAMAFGLPMFAYLLLRSRNAYKRGQVSWKGRVYDVDSASGDASERSEIGDPISRLANQTLSTENRELRTGN
jgi:glycosyltransferase involved in cell wall biosynthesis